MLDFIYTLLIAPLEYWMRLWFGAIRSPKLGGLPSS